MQRLVTIVANGDVAIQDTSGLEAYNQSAQFLGAGVKGGSSVTFKVGEGQWDRIRPQLVELSQRRIPQPSAPGKTWPLMTYQVDFLPGSRPSIDQVEGTLSVGGGAQTVTLRGTNFVGGTKAEYTILAGTTRSLRFVAVMKGPAGENVTINLAKASGAGSVTTIIGKDGAVVINVIPAAGGPGANAIAAQIAASTPAATFVVATGGGTGVVGVFNGIKMTGGDGNGHARIMVPSVPKTGWLHLVATKTGNDQNLITLTINAGAVGNTVVVTGTNIVVNRTSATPQITAVRDAIIADSGVGGAASLVIATLVGTDGTLAGTTKTYANGGSGETPAITIGGGACTIVSVADTAIVLSVTGAQLTTAGVANGEQAVIVMRGNYGLVSAQLSAGA